MQDTIFDKILKREIPCNPVYEDDWVLAFRDINPQAPVHVLVIPKKKLKGFSAFKTAAAADIGEYIKRVSLVATELGLDPKGYRIVFNEGHNGQQTVPYIHAHILGERQMHWPPG